jgi:hypothetical protein
MFWYDKATLFVNLYYLYENSEAYVLVGHPHGIPTPYLELGTFGGDYANDEWPINDVS